MQITPAAKEFMKGLETVEECAQDPRIEQMLNSTQQHRKRLRQQEEEFENDEGDHLSGLDEEDASGEEDGTLVDEAQSQQREQQTRRSERLRSAKAVAATATADDGNVVNIAKGARNGKKQRKI